MQKGPINHISFLITYLMLISFSQYAIAEDTPRIQSDNFETLRTSLSEWLNDASNETPFKSSKYIKSWIVDKWDEQKEDYQIIDVRTHNNFTKKGHIPNAINIHWKSITKTENINKFDPMITTIVYSDLGYEAGVSSVILNLLDFKTFNMKFGLMDWNLSALSKKPWDKNSNFKVVKNNTLKNQTFHLPVIVNNNKSTEDIIKSRYQTHVLNKKVTIPSKGVKKILSNWNLNNEKYQIISVRTKKDYLNGHIEHAINIPWNEILDKKQLIKIDPNKTVILYCYTGFQAGAASTLLNFLGYNTVNMRFGMMDWNQNHIPKTTSWNGRANYPIIHD